MPDIKTESPARNRVNAAWLRAQIEALRDTLDPLDPVKLSISVDLDRITKGVDWRVGK